MALNGREQFTHIITRFSLNRNELGRFLTVEDDINLVGNNQNRHMAWERFRILLQDKINFNGHVYSSRLGRRLVTVYVRCRNRQCRRNFRVLIDSSMIRRVFDVDHERNRLIADFCGTPGSVICNHSKAFLN